MTAAQNATLVKLGDTDKTVADPAQDVRHHDVRDRQGEDIGKVDDLMLDAEEGKVRFLVVGSGGFLGLGKEETFIPVDAITSITDEEVRIDQTREQVAGAPAYDPDLADQTPYFEEVYRYYGFGPFWGPGYAYPAFAYY